MSKLVVKTYPMGPIQVNTYLVWAEGSKGCWVIDPGGLPKPLLAEIGKNDLVLEKIVNTHGHWDHFMGNTALKEACPQASIAIHLMDAMALVSADVNLSQAFVGKAVTSPPAEEFLDDGATLMLGDLTFSVIHTPGHSPGGVCLYCAEAKTAFVGDLIFAGGGVGRTDLPMGSPAQLYNSIEKFLHMVTPDTTFYPGHGPSTIASEEKIMLL